MKIHNKLRRQKRRELERKAEEGAEHPTEVDNFSAYYAHQNRHIHSSKGMVQGFYQYVGKVKEE